jgi:hypothetical protein
MKVKKIFIFIFIFLLSTKMVSSQKSVWNILSMVSVTTQFDQEFGIEIKKVKTSPLVKSMQGKEIELDGYIIPLTGKLAQTHFMLSKFSEKMCFFCGKAGPETAAQVFLANNVKQKYVDEKIRVKGILRINENDPSGLLYTVDQAQVLE